MKKMYYIIAWCLITLNMSIQPAPLTKHQTMAIQNHLNNIETTLLKDLLADLKLIEESEDKDLEEDVLNAIQIKKDQEEKKAIALKKELKKEQIREKQRLKRELEEVSLSSEEEEESDKKEQRKQLKKREKEDQKQINIERISQEQETLDRLAQEEQKKQELIRAQRAQEKSLRDEERIKKQALEKEQNKQARSAREQQEQRLAHMKEEIRKKEETREQEEAQEIAPLSAQAPSPKLSIEEMKQYIAKPRGTEMIKPSAPSTVMSLEEELGQEGLKEFDANTSPVQPASPQEDEATRLKRLQAEAFEQEQSEWLGHSKTHGIIEPKSNTQEQAFQEEQEEWLAHSKAHGEQLD